MAGTSVASWVVGQVQLVVVFGIPKHRNRGNLAHNPVLGVKVFLQALLGHSRYLHLLVVMCKYAGSVLRANVAALPVHGSRVMHSKEKVNQLAVTDLLRIKRDLQGLGMACALAAHSPVVGILLGSSAVAHFRIDQPFAFKILAVDVLNT